jgi:CheY-like chemotaxis protein/nitrogen-specific signal transduction histidine kinase
VLFNGSVFKDEKGIVQGVVVVARDITKQIMYEDELIAAKDKSEESTTLIEAFLANMSHEIRTPMNAIMGFADLLAKKNLGEKEKEYVKVIKTAGEKLLLIINDILDISKIEAGMMSFESVSFSIKETLKSLNVMFSERARQKNIELEFNCDKSVPDILRGDHTRLTQIIINLVDNAIKFTREGNVMMNVTMRNRDGNKVSVEFSVSDTGIGIPPEKINTIFERFTQAEKHTTRMYGGTGLGLSIARQLVELQGGEITVKSEINKGTVFTFWIPYTITTQTLEVSESVDSVCNMEYLSKLKVLLVEDSLLNVQLVSSLFSENNLNLQVAENGRLCLQMLKENEYDIVLMDMEMPVMNGYEATNEIRQTLKSNIPIIAITAHAMAGERERCLNLGMNDYVSKPINSVLLFEKMFELTKNKS